MTLTPDAVEFVGRFGLTDVCQIGSELRLGPADYWKLANQAAHLVVHPETDGTGKKPGFLATIGEFDCYLDNDVAGTGMTRREP